MRERPERADAVADWAASGVVPLTGEPDGPPLVPPGCAASVAAELGALLGVDGAALLGERTALTGARRAGRVSVGGRCRLLPTRDGWAAVSCARPDDVALLGALVGHELSGPQPDASFAGALAGMSGAELDERAALLGIPAGAVTVPGRPATGGSVVPPGPLRPVRGMLVVSFGALWAAPLCAQLLAAAGARVVTVETPARPDPTRSSQPAFHDLLHGHDRSVQLDPITDGGRRAMARLVAAADVVIEASRPRALRGFGLDAEIAVARGATWVSITADGRDSPRVGFGDDVAAAAGLVARTPSGAPVFVGDAIADPLTGLVAAVAARTSAGSGSGALHDISMRRVVAATLDGSPSRTTRYADGRWWADAGTGPVPVATPRSRRAPGRAPRLGADTREVLTGTGPRR